MKEAVWKSVNALLLLLRAYHDSDPDVKIDRSSERLLSALSEWLAHADHAPSSATAKRDRMRRRTATKGA